LNISIFDLKEMNDKKLFSLVEHTLRTYPLLKEIYEKEFVADLIKKRFFHDNYLLWLLVSKSDYAMLTWDSVVKNLELLKDCYAVSHFKGKLRSKRKTIFESYLTELEFAGHHKERGFKIELEPQILRTHKGPDFKIEQNGFQIFFEIGNLFAEEIMEMDSLENHIHGFLARIDYPFVIGINFDPDKFKIKHLKILKDFINNKLHQLDEYGEIKFPLSFFFPNEKEALVEVKVLGRPKKRKYGYLGIIGTKDAFMIPDGDRIRRKISKKISQLPKGYANVLVIEFGHLFFDQTDIEDALFGTQVFRVHVKPDTKDISGDWVRTGDKIFVSHKNTRLSALIYSQRRFQGNEFLRTKKVYHNPFASNSISKEFFSEPGTKQLISIKEGNVYRMEWV